MYRNESRTRVSLRLALCRASSLAFAFALGLATACGGAQDRDGPPSVVLVVLEETRADHVSSYGYGSPTTPALDALAACAVRFTRCRATSPGTQASLASIFTGRFTYQHGAHPLLPDRELFEQPLALGRQTLAEVLAAEGYATAAFVSDGEFLGEDYQLDQGFAEYVAEGGAGSARNRRVFEWLHDVRGPFFLCVSYADARPPYNTLPLEDERASTFAVNDVVPSETLLEGLRAELLGARLGPPSGVDRAAILAELRARYDLGLANADRALGELLEHLRAAGLLDESLVIVTADHGTYFGEHQLIGHSKDVYEEALHVPLVVKRPGVVAGGEDDRLLSVADVPGLVAAAMPEPLAASLRAAFPLPLERDLSVAELYHSRAVDVRRHGERFKRVRRVLYAGDHKLIRSSDGRNELYDLRIDPAEANDLARSEPQLVQELSQRLVQFLREHPEEPLPEFGQARNAPPDHRLRDVGYPGGTASELTRDAERVLDDE